MSVGSLTVLLFVALAIPANAAADDKDRDRAWHAVGDYADLLAQSRRSLEASLLRMREIACRLEQGEDGEKLAPSIRKVLKLASDRDIDSQLVKLVRALAAKHAYQTLDVLVQVLRDCQNLSNDLKAIRLVADKCRPPQIDTPALRRDLAAVRAALDVEGGKIGKELKAHVAKLPADERPAGDLGELLDRVLVGQSGEGKSPRGGGGEGKVGQAAGVSQQKPGEKKAGRGKVLPYSDSLFRRQAKDHADLEALVQALDAHRWPLERVTARLKGKTQTACEELNRQLWAVHNRTYLHLSLHVQLEKLASVEEALVEVRRLVKIVRDDLVNELLKD